MPVVPWELIIEMTSESVLVIHENIVGGGEIG